MLGRPLLECLLLHVEDDDTSAFLFQKALLERIPFPKLFRVSDGEQAWEFLSQTGVYGSVPRPDLVLLDLNLPKRHGFEVLASMKCDPNLLTIPVVVFSTFLSPQDREKALHLGAVSYLYKDGSFDGFVNAADLVCRMIAA